MSDRPPAVLTVLKLAGCCLLASVVATAMLFPFAGGLGLMSNRASEVVANGSAQLLEAITAESQPAQVASQGQPPQGESTPPANPTPVQGATNSAAPEAPAAAEPSA